jgi:predicted  nucleic acid-binding Zn-ribbon protein
VIEYFMPKPLQTKKVVFTLLAALVSVASLQVFITPVRAVEIIPSVNIGSTLEDQLKQIELELEQIRNYQSQLKGNISAQQNKIGMYSGEIGRLRGEVETLQLRIAELELKMQETDLNKQILEEEITALEKKIEELQAEVAALEKESDRRIKQSYIDHRFSSRMSVDFFAVKDANTYFRDSQYRELIQDKTNKMLDRLAEMRIELDRDRNDLEEKMVSVRRDEAILGEQRSQLDHAKADFEEQMSVFTNALYVAQSNINQTQQTLSIASEEEAKKVAEGEKIKQELFNSFNSIPSGQYVLAGTQIGRQGSTGYSTGPHLHFFTVYNGQYRNPCDFLPAGVLAECGWGNQLQWPLHGTFYYTSRYYSGENGDYRCFYYNGTYTCDVHLAIDIAHSVWNAPVYAAHDGWLGKGVDNYGALYIVICENKMNCSSGFKTGYWHLSSY